MPVITVSFDDCRLLVNGLVNTISGLESVYDRVVNNSPDYAYGVLQRLKAACRLYTELESVQYIFTSPVVSKAVYGK